MSRKAIHSWHRENSALTMTSKLNPKMKCVISYRAFKKVDNLTHTYSNFSMTITRQCPSTSPSHSVVWKKCCPENQMLSQTNPGTCVNSTPSIFRPKVNGVLQSFSVINLTLANFTCPRGYHLRKLSTNICAARSKSRYLQIYPFRPRHFFY